MPRAITTKDVRAVTGRVKVIVLPGIFVSLGYIFYLPFYLPPIAIICLWMLSGLKVEQIENFLNYVTRNSKICYNIYCYASKTKKYKWQQSALGCKTFGELKNLSEAWIKGLKVYVL